MTTEEIRNALNMIEELTGKSQHLWDHAWTNAVIADHPDKDRFTQMTYEATRLHAACMDVLRTLSASALLQQAEAGAMQACVAGMTDLQRVWHAINSNALGLPPSEEYDEQE